jgi:hypothetical protein
MTGTVYARARRVLPSPAHAASRNPRCGRPRVEQLPSPGRAHRRTARFTRFDTLREQTQLGAGLTADKKLDRASQARALEVLAQFRERLRGLPRDAVRAVGTNALRIAKNSPAFLREARETLGFPIEVIAGREEARLIYLGRRARAAARGEQAASSSTSVAAPPS